MLSLVIAILFGLSITFFAFQNSVGVPIVLGSFFLPNIPMYLVVVVSLLAGIFMAWFISALEGVSHFMNVRQKDSVINQDKKEINGLQKKLNDLQLENAKLRGEKKEIAMNKNNDSAYVNDLEYKPSFLERIFPSSTRRYSKQV